MWYCDFSSSLGSVIKHFRPPATTSYVSQSDSDSLLHCLEGRMQYRWTIIMSGVIYHHSSPVFVVYMVRLLFVQSKKACKCLYTVPQRRKLFKHNNYTCYRILSLDCQERFEAFHLLFVEREYL
uniref:Uncharacterized protein n=1 Tax=Arundo donax TaxID=35708 RepID=A0A0A8XQ58_ARUDO